MRRNLKVLFQNLSISLVTLVILFLIGEISCRIYCALKWKDPIYLYRYSLNRDIFFELNPGWEGEFGGVPVKINSLGLRDYEYSLNKDKDVYRILVVGDSKTFGWRTKLEDTFQKVLEKELNNKLSKYSGYKYEVINAGVSGYNTRQEVAYLESRGLKLKPDLVILGFFVNDIADYNAKPVRVLPQVPIWGLPHSLKDISRKSFFFQFLTLKWELLRERFDKRFDIEGLHSHDEFYKGIISPATEPYWREFNKQLEKLTKLLKENNIKMLILYWPRINQLNKSEEWQRLQDILGRFAERNNFYFLDLVPQHKKSTQWPFLSDKFPGDYHPNEVGHRLAAEAIFDLLTKNKIIPQAKY